MLPISGTDQLREGFLTNGNGVPACVTSAVQQAAKQAGTIDVLVNNAGVASAGPVEDYSDQELRYVFETNFLGVVRTSRAVLPSSSFPRRSSRPPALGLLSSRVSRYACLPP